MTVPPLPRFDELWSRSGALAVAFRAAGHADVWRGDHDGLHHDDGGGNTARLVPLSAGRGVVFGFDHEYSATVAADPPIDLLADAPAWLPWDLLVPPAEAGELGFCRWWDGTAWTDGNPPVRDVADGLHPVLSGVTDAAGAVRSLVEVATTWRDVEPPAEAAADLEAGAAALLRAAQDGRVTPGDVERLFALAPVERSAVDAAVRTASACGLTDGAARPARDPLPAPATRRVRRLSAEQHTALVHAAMAREAERERPTTSVSQPVPGRLARALGRSPWSAAERRLLDHVRARLAPGSDRGVLVALTTGVWSTSCPDPEHPLDDADRGAVFADLEEAQALRDADAGPQHGAWFYVRAEVGPDVERIERAFDGIPPWWTGDAEQRGPDVDALRRELEGRDPAWWPSWAALVTDDDVAFADVAVPRGA